MKCRGAATFSHPPRELHAGCASEQRKEETAKREEGEENQDPPVKRLEESKGGGGGTPGSSLGRGHKGGDAAEGRVEGGEEQAEVVEAPRSCTDSK